MPKTSAITVPPDTLPLESLYTYERDRRMQLYLTQPLPGGEIQVWTWGSCMHEVRCVAQWLKDQGWPPGSRIALLSKNCAWWIMADFAIWMAGYVTVPLFPVAKDSSLVALLVHSDPVACFLGVLDEPFQHSSMDMRKVRLVTFPGVDAADLPESTIAWNDIVDQGTPMKESPQRSGEDVATIIYTSGTTGGPKGAMQTFRSLALMGRSVAAANPGVPHEAERMISYLPLAHIAERAVVEMQSLTQPVEIFFSLGLSTFLDDLKRARATCFFSIPRLYLRFQQGVFQKIPAKRLNFLLRIPFVGKRIGHKILDGLGLAHARVISAGGAPTPVEIVRWYEALGANFVEGYGMTETGVTHAALPGKALAGYVGTASEFAETRIGENGEVQIKGPMNMLGYYRDPALSASVFTADGFFRTGDRGEIDQEGRLKLIGRLKEEFKTSKGKYISPSRLESLLSLSPLFEIVAIFGSGMAAPFALVVLAADRRAGLNDPEIRKQIESQIKEVVARTNRQLDHHEHVRFVVVSEQPWTAESGLMTPTLKVKRSVVEMRISDRFQEWENSSQRVLWIPSVETAKA